MSGRVLVCGAGGFIGNHLVRRLKRHGHWVRGVDLRRPEFCESAADEFVIGDLADAATCHDVCDGRFDQIFQLAAEMGGVGYICAGSHDADIMWKSSVVNLNVLSASSALGVRQLFFPSSACVYPEYNQRDPLKPRCSEDTAYPAAPDTEYGWEKLFAERLYSAFHRAGRIRVSIARLHNVYGPENAWTGGREKAVAALCRKAAEAEDGQAIEVWGDGFQTRSFLYIEDCLDGISALMQTAMSGPVNIGSEEMVTLTELALMIIRLSGKRLTIRHIPGPQGVRGRTSDNRLIRRETGWKPEHTLKEGVAKTYGWVALQVTATQTSPTPL